MEMSVWAYKKLNELNGELGYVAVEVSLGKKLIANGSVQDVMLGAKALKYEDNVTAISDGIPAATNPTKPVVTPKPTTTNPVASSDEPEIECEPKKKKKKKNK